MAESDIKADAVFRAAGEELKVPRLSASSSRSNSRRSSFADSSSPLKTGAVSPRRKKSEATTSTAEGRGYESSDDSRSVETAQMELEMFGIDNVEVFV
jgi:hypothetical protein